MSIVNGQDVEAHYSSGSTSGNEIFNKIKTYLNENNITTVRLTDLAPVDEFHIGGIPGTISLMDKLDIKSTDTILDVGAGLGGPARFVADKYGCKVIGVDLTKKFVDAGNEITDSLFPQLKDKVHLVVGSGLDLEKALPSDSTGLFDKAYLLHVGMNITDKTKLINEISKKLKPNGKLAIYDVMKMSSDELEFPLPWASDKSHDACASVDVYKKAFENSGFNVTVENSRLEFGLGVFEKRKMHSGKTPFGLNVHQENFATKGANMVKNMKAGRMAPYELIGVKNNITSSNNL